MFVMKLSRRSMLQSAMLLPAIGPVSRAFAQDADADVLSQDAVLRDPEIPVAGNPDGDITIVEFFDYRCPYCKKVHPDLLQVVQDDGKIRLVYKDWPIFGGVSVDAARLTLASKYQNKFVEAHNALIGAKSNLTTANIAPFLTDAGIDADRAARDLVANAKAIDAVLARSDAQAKAFGFQGTPAFIIGKFRVPGALSVANFKQAIKDARAALKKT
jgi:protein-disulfide isomerase